jgi:hypothetical protein
MSGTHGIFALPARTTTSSCRPPTNSVNCVRSLGFTLALVCGIVSCTNAQTAQTFSFTGSNQLFVVPVGVTSIDAKLWGGGGAGGTKVGGGAAFVFATLAVTPGETLTIIVGGGGHEGIGGTNTSGNAFGGGGNSGFGGGGGRSGIQISGIELVDAGGGGAGAGGLAPNGNAASLQGSGSFSAAASQGQNGVVSGTQGGGGGGGWTGGSGGSPTVAANGGTSFHQDGGGVTVSGFLLTGGAGSNPGDLADTDRVGGAGAGGNGIFGGNGLVVLRYAPVASTPGPEALPAFALMLGGAWVFCRRKRI